MFNTLLKRTAVASNSSSNLLIKSLFNQRATFTTTTRHTSAFLKNVKKESSPILVFPQTSSNKSVESKSIVNQVLQSNLLNNQYRFEQQKRFNSSSSSTNQENSEQQQQQQQQQDKDYDKEIPVPEGDRKVGRWLLFSAGLVGAMIVIGGITRLTESGLSMTDWKPIVGAIPPITDKEWEQEFEKYKQFPEYKVLNQGMTVDEFKKIFFWEYSHRLLGRVIGVAFFFPFVYYLKKGYINKPLAKKLSVIFLLGGAQGALGWYMVKSGLDEKTIIGEVPRVSPYRLAAHLGSAFVIYAALLSIGLGLVRPGLSRAMIDRLKAAASSSQISNFVPRLKKYSHYTAGAVFLTAMSGAFVAGLDAGLVHNTWPKMGDDWIPEDIINPKIKPVYKNAFEHDVMAQFNHRNLATLTYFGILGLSAFAFRGRKCLSPRARLAANCLAGMATFQVALGITTLLTFVPIPLAAAHQTGSLTLLSIAIWLMHELKKLPK
ncbi:hypothetical protein CYY_003424 [Polysphondylium violaceum]|uniref:Cytochrome c oxidase assembly protein n=1 Tax=Polysphondylium violaceum TaxID=133409 RepID=A0A8J4PWT7_9MYCE|nr:hypothetical protein CYY_003424 [Polysphondylium violaceum]